MTQDKKKLVVFLEDEPVLKEMFEKRLKPEGIPMLFVDTPQKLEDICKPLALAGNLGMIVIDDNPDRAYIDENVIDAVMNIGHVYLDRAIFISGTSKLRDRISATFCEINQKDGGPWIKERVWQEVVDHMKQLDLQEVRRESPPY